MPSPIGTVGQLVAAIQAQLAAGVAVKQSTPRAPARRPAAAASHAYSPHNLESLIGQRVKSIERDDPDKGRKAFRIFLESILLSHFGEQLINDPKFYQLVDEVQVAMEADADIRRLIDGAIAHLLAAPD